MANNVKNPPLLESSASYESWEKSLKLWQLVTDLKVEKQGPALVLSLTGKAKEAVLELEVKEISSATGVQQILDKLGKIYKKDKVDTAYESFERFIYFHREPEMNMSKFISEFESRYNKAKQHGCVLSTSILGFFLLNQAKLSESNKKLIKATITELEFEDIKTKLKKVFATKEDSSILKDDDVKVKIEDLNIAEEEEEDVFYGVNNSRGSRGYRRSTSRYPRAGFGNFRGSNNYNQYHPRSYGESSYQNHYPRSYGESNNQNRGSFNQYSRSYTENNNNQRRNPYKSGYNAKGNKIRCSVCESIYHLNYECPEKIYHCQEEEEDGEVQHDVVLYQSNLLTEREFKIFVAESSTSAILDCGASATVAGKVWFDGYCEGLSEAQHQQVQFFNSNASFKFGSGEKFKSLFKALIPANIGSKDVYISTDVVETAIPLLLSKESMKKAGTEINFVNDTVKMFGSAQRSILFNLVIMQYH